MNPKYELEVHRKVYDNQHGSNIIVRPDRDALGLVEIILEENGVLTKHAIIMDPEQALIVAKALSDCAQEIIEKNASEN